MDFHEFSNFMKEEIPSEPDENDNNNKALDFEIKIEVKVKSEDHEKLDWCLQEIEIRDEKFLQPDEFSSFEELYALRCQKCRVCHAVFLDRYSLLCHNLTHLFVPLSQPKLYQCDHCLVYYTKKIKLSIHLKLKHFTILGYKTSQNHECLICHRTFSYRHWHAHMNNCHGTGRLKCPYCDDIYKCKRYLKRHICKKHTKSAKKIKQASNKPIIPQQCDMCPKIFKNKDCLAHHKANCHSAPVECPLCKKTLKSQPYLYTHLRRMHSEGERKCDFCPKKFRTKRNVDRHIKNIHLRNVLTPLNMKKEKL